MEVYVKMRKWGHHVLLAVCDSELLGKTLREGEIVFEINEDFYKGFKTSVEEAANLIEESTIVNLVGCNIVDKAVKRGYVHPQAIIKISGVPHAQIVKM